MNKQFWSGKKVFITGHTGFKGSWLTTWLKLLGASITGYSLAPETNPNLFELACVSDGINSIEGNILDVDSLRHAMRTQCPEIVFHLAAQPLVRYSYANPVETYEVNVIGTLNVLEAVRSIESVKAVIVVTSDKCYENQEWVWGYRESDPMGGFDPYSSSKGCTELAVSSYRRSFFNVSDYAKHGVGLATVRAGNVIGGGDWAEARLIPDLIRSFTKNETAMIRNPNAHRPWQYILDVLTGYLILAQKLYESGSHFSDAWNFGPNDENVKSVSWIADKMTQLWGEKAKYSVNQDTLLHEANCLKLDSNKSRTILGWEPKSSIEDVLENTINWYQAFFQQKNMKQFTERQIATY